MVVQVTEVWRDFAGSPRLHPEGLRHPDVSADLDRRPHRCLHLLRARPVVVEAKPVALHRGPRHRLGECLPPARIDWTLKPK